MTPPYAILVTVVTRITITTRKRVEKYQNSGLRLFQRNRLHRAARTKTQRKSRVWFCSAQLVFPIVLFSSNQIIASTLLQKCPICNLQFASSALAVIEQSVQLLLLNALHLSPEVKKVIHPVNQIFIKSLSDKNIRWKLHFVFLLHQTLTV